LQILTCLLENFSGGDEMQKLKNILAIILIVCLVVSTQTAAVWAAVFFEDADAAVAEEANQPNFGEYAGVMVDEAEEFVYDELIGEPDEDSNPVSQNEDTTPLVKVAKVDIATGEELEGAAIQILDKDSSVVEEWTSTKEVHEITGLLIGEEYTLHEDEAPDGYIVAPDTTFTIDETGKVISTGKVNEDGVLLVEDAKTFIKVSRINSTHGKEAEGAEIQILDKDGSVIDAWTSGTEAHEVIGLKTGVDYTIHEQVAPEGCKAAGDSSFTIDENGKVTSTGTVNEDGVLLIEDAKPSVSFLITDSASGEALEGAQLQLLDDEGNVIEEWTSTKEAYVLKNLRTDVTYTVHENAAPDGFAVAPETKLCIDSNNNVTFTGKKTTEGILLIEDARTSIKIAKVDKTSGEKVEGAKIQILDKEGIVFEEWRSGKEAHEVTGLKTGEIYILREIEAPVGYALAADTEFALKADGTIDMSKTTAVVENGEILIKDSKIRVTISLQDVNGNLIGGAVLKISYRNNKEVEGRKWTTVAGQDYTIIGLSAGKYYLYEVTTPAGYLKAARIPFEVDEYGRITRDGKVVSKIVMVNQKVSRSSNSGTSTRTTTERSTVTRTNDSTGTGKATTDRKVSSTRAKGAKTGDDNNTAIYLIMMALSAGAITAIAATKKKKRANG
jgi:LPXTG-motif cell wall-anchored protein